MWDKLQWYLREMRCMLQKEQRGKIHLRNKYTKNKEDKNHDYKIDDLDKDEAQN